MTLRKRDLVPLLPLVALLVVGWQGAPWWIYADILASMVVLLLVCNPFWLIGRYLCPETRWGAASAVVLVVAGVQLPELELPARICLVLVGVGMLLVFAAKNREWRTQWLFQQSPQADLVEAHLAHQGSWSAGTAWEEYGCRESRGLLHQALSAEATEEQLATVYKAVYQLGFLHGMAVLEAEMQATEEARDKASKENARLKAQLEAQEAEIRRVEEYKAAAEHARAKQEYAESGEMSWHAHAMMADKKIEALEAQLKQLQPPEQMTQVERDAAILALVESGMSIAEAGGRYNLTKGGAAGALRRARAARDGQKEARGSECSKSGVHGAGNCS